VKLPLDIALLHFTVEGVSHSTWPSLIINLFETRYHFQFLHPLLKRHSSQEILLLVFYEFELFSTLV